MPILAQGSGNFAIGFTGKKLMHHLLFAKGKGRQCFYFGQKSRLLIFTQCVIDPKISVALKQQRKVVVKQG
jgi:hypothetical protein